MAFRYAAFLTIASLLPLGAKAVPKKAGNWIELSAPHFTILTDAGGARARAAARDLETLRALLLQVAGGVKVDSPRPTMVYIFRDEEGFRPYKGGTKEDPREKMAGYFIRGLHANLLAMNAKAAGNPQAIWYHEYLHEVMSLNYESLPLWFNEGMAEFYSTFSCEEKEAEIGRPVAEHIYWIREHPLIPLRDLFAVTHESPEYNETSKQGVFYAQSWALVHYLLRGNPERRPQVVRFLDLLDGGARLDDAFGLAFQAEYADLEKELRAYVARDSFPYARVSLASLDAAQAGQERRLTEPEALYHLGELLLSVSNGANPDIEAHFLGVLERDPGHARAKAGLGLAYSRQGRHEEAARLLQEATSGAPSDPFICHAAASVLLQRITGGAGDKFAVADQPSAEARAAREILTRCVQLDPEDPSVQADYGLTYLLLQDQDPAPGIAALQKARRRLPARIDILMNLIALHVAGKDRRAAAELIDRDLGPAAAPEQVQEARELLASLDLEQAGSRLAEGRFEEGIERLRSAREQAASPDLRARIDAEILRAEAALAREREIAAYNAALAMIRKGDLRQAAEALEKLAGSCADPVVCAETKKLLEDLGKACPGARKP